MKRFALLLLLLLAMPLVGCDQTATVPMTPAVNLENPETMPWCRVEAMTGYGTMNKGSGTLVDRNAHHGLVITAGHVVAAKGPFRVKFPNGAVREAALIGFDGANDLAALLILEPESLPVPLGHFDGQGTYHAYGFGADGRLNRVDGRVKGYYQPVRSGMSGTTYACANITGNAVPGDSGAGTVNDAGGYVGVLWGGADGAFITMGEPVMQFLARLVRDGRWLPTPGFRPDQLASKGPAGQSPRLALTSYQVDQAVAQTKLVENMGLFDRGSRSGGSQPGCPTCRPGNRQPTNPSGRTPVRGGLGLDPRTVKQAVDAIPSIAAWKYLLAGSPLGICLPIVAGLATFLVVGHIQSERERDED